MSYRDNRDNNDDNRGQRPNYGDRGQQNRDYRPRDQDDDRFQGRNQGYQGRNDRPHYDNRDGGRGFNKFDNRDERPQQNYGGRPQYDDEPRFRRDEPRDRFQGGNRDRDNYQRRQPDHDQRDQEFHRGPPRQNYNRDDDGGRGGNFREQRRSRSREFQRGSPPRQNYRDRQDRGGDRPGGDRGGDRPRFGDRPQHSYNSRNQQAVVKPKNVLVESNQFKLQLQGNTQVYQYPIEIQGMEMWDADLVQRIIKYKAATFEKCFGLYVASGKSVYMLQQLTENISIEAGFRGAKYTIVIDTSQVQSFGLSADFTNDQNSVHQSLINIIIKQAFRNTNLKQVGKTPKFFDVKNFIDMPQQRMKIMNGFKASAQNNQFGCSFVIDSIFKFQSTQSCFDRMEELRKDTRDDQEWQKRCREEFIGSSILADWGNQRQYIVDDINFELTPGTYKFECRGQMMSLGEYFNQTYKKECNRLHQPLFLVKISNRESYLPSEFCLVDGVPASVKKSMGMRDCLAKTRIDPAEKSKRIREMVQELCNQKALKDWGFVIEPQGTTMDTRVLDTPQMLQQNQLITCDENIMRQSSIGKAVHLTRGDWIFVHERQSRSAGMAKEIVRTFQQASGRLKINVEDPEFLEIDRESNCREELQRKLNDYMCRSRQIKHPLIVVILLNRESNYPMMKEVMMQFSCPSQVITTRNANKFALAKATNILRQINSKMGGDLYYMKFPAALDSKYCMLIGIDVCHAGPQSIVGFTASTNREMSQYFNDYIVQRKGQEIVQTKMKELCEEAIKVFKKSNDGNLPTNFIIYRDGVGDAQRNQVLNSEIPQLEEAIRQLYKDESTKPAITVVVVNKRIHQRFFVKEASGRLVNPPSGCIIDQGLVDTHQDAQQFDFYLTPSSANQGCVLPTHFYVPRNDSDLSRFEIEHLSYALCHFYFNWAGPIKVPAPCQYAHKVGEYYMTTGVAKRKGQNQPRVDPRCEDTIRDIQSSIKPLNEKLHFL